MRLLSLVQIYQCVSVHLGLRNRFSQTPLLRTPKIFIKNSFYGSSQYPFDSVGTTKSCENVLEKSPQYALSEFTITEFIHTGVSPVRAELGPTHFPKYPTQIWAIFGKKIFLYSKSHEKIKSIHKTHTNCFAQYTKRLRIQRKRLSMNF